MNKRQKKALKKRHGVRSWKKYKEKIRVRDRVWKWIDSDENNVSEPMKQIQRDNVESYIFHKHYRWQPIGNGRYYDMERMVREVRNAHNDGRIHGEWDHPVSDTVQCDTVIQDFTAPNRHKRVYTPEQISDMIESFDKKLKHEQITLEPLKGTPMMSGYVTGTRVEVDKDGHERIIAMGIIRCEGKDEPFEALMHSATINEKDMTGFKPGELAQFPRKLDSALHKSWMDLRFPRPTVIPEVAAKLESEKQELNLVAEDLKKLATYEMSLLGVTNPAAWNSVTPPPPVEQIGEDVDVLTVEEGVSTVAPKTDGRLDSLLKYHGIVAGSDRLFNRSDTAIRYAGNSCEASASD